MYEPIFNYNVQVIIVTLYIMQYFHKEPVDK